MTRDEILGLSKMTEDEQIDMLERSGIIENYAKKCPNCGHWLAESLADCAERLWEDAIYGMTAEDHRTIAARYFNNNCFTELQEYIWWFIDAKPIHRIQAALLVKESPK